MGIDVIEGGAQVVGTRYEDITGSAIVCGG